MTIHHTALDADVNSHVQTGSQLVPAAGRRPVGVSRLVAWALAAGAAGILLLSGHAYAVAPLCLVAAVMAASAMAPSPGAPRVGVMFFLPGGFVLLCAWGLVWGLISGIAGTDAWNGRAAAAFGVLVFAAATGLVSARRGGRVLLVGADRAGLVGGVALVGYFAWVVGSQSFAVWSRTMSSGTDFLRHLRAIRALRADGGLEFAQDAYPSALHSLGAWLTSATGVTPTPDSLWRAVAPICFLLLALVLVGLVLTADRITRLVVSRQQGMPGSGPSRSASAAGWAAAALSGAAFVQTAWFDVFLGFGHIMNILVGVCLVALLVAALEPQEVAPGIGPLIAASAVAVTANAWQILLPVAAFGALPWVVASLRSWAAFRRDAATWLVGAVLVANGLLIARHLDVAAQAAVPTVSGLFTPEWWWWVAGVLAVSSVVLAYRSGRRMWSAGALGLLCGGIAVTTALVVATGSSLELMLYYPVKTLWTAIVVVIPLAAISAVSLSLAAWRRSRDSVPLGRVLVRSVLVVVAVLACAGVLGRGAAGPSRLEALADASTLMPNWSMAVEESMDATTSGDVQQAGVIAFGIVPDAQLSRSSAWYAGVVDFMAMEALGDVGFVDAIGAPVKEALIRRDITAVCRHLESHPSSLRITGPLPAAGPGVLVAGGCPEKVVEPERWTSLDFDEDWLAGTPWAAAARSGST